MMVTGKTGGGFVPSVDSKCREKYFSGPAGDGFSYPGWIQGYF